MESTPFALILKEHRTRLGLSRSQLSERSGLSYPYISQLETSLRKPSRKAAYSIAQALGVDVSVLEGSIPGDDTDPAQRQRAQEFATQAMSHADEPATGSGRKVRAASGSAVTNPPGREDLLGDMIDILEEFDSSERLEILGELQKRAMQRMLDEQRRRPS